MLFHAFHFIKKLNIILYFIFSEGRKHDAGMLVDSGLLHDLEQFAFNPAGQPLCVYGDPAYPLRVHLQGPFKQMEEYNAAMNAVRNSVEWLFGDMVNSFKLKL